MATNDKLGTMAGANTAWDWKREYISGLSGGKDGLERFSQLSATPDTTALFAGPARFTGLAGDPQKLVPIGLTDGVSMNQSPQLQRLYEIGSNRAFFTSGKTAGSISFQTMLADQGNIVEVLTRNSRPSGLLMNDSGSAAAGVPGSNIFLNLDSEITKIPFGLMLVFKTRGGYNSGDQRGHVLAAVYLEYCMFANFNFNVSAGMPVIMQGVAMEYDRPVPVDIR